MCCIQSIKDKPSQGSVDSNQMLLVKNIYLCTQLPNMCAPTNAVNLERNKAVSHI